VPYHAVAQDTSAFVPAQYRPDNLTIKDPRNMHKDDLQRLLQNILDRQLAEGPASAFKFSKVILDNQQMPSQYLDDLETTGQAAPRRKARKAKPKKNLPVAADILDGLISINDPMPDGGVGDLMPDTALNPIDNISQPTRTQEGYTEMSCEDRNKMVQAGFYEVEHAGWVADGVPRFRVKTNIWLMYNQLVRGGHQGIDPALYQTGQYFTGSAQILLKGSCRNAGTCTGTKQGNLASPYVK
jgi:hypothetical protein